MSICSGESPPKNIPGIPNWQSFLQRQNVPPSFSFFFFFLTKTFERCGKEPAVTDRPLYNPEWPVTAEPTTTTETIVFSFSTSLANQPLLTCLAFPVLLESSLFTVYIFSVSLKRDLLIRQRRSGPPLRALFLTHTQSQQSSFCSIDAPVRLVVYLTIAHMNLCPSVGLCNLLSIGNSRAGQRVALESLRQKRDERSHEEEEEETNENRRGLSRDAFNMALRKWDSTTRDR